MFSPFFRYHHRKVDLERIDNRNVPNLPEHNFILCCLISNNNLKSNGIFIVQLQHMRSLNTGTASALCPNGFILTLCPSFQRPFRSQS